MIKVTKTLFIFSMLICCSIQAETIANMNKQDTVAYSFISGLFAKETALLEEAGPSALATIDTSIWMTRDPNMTSGDVWVYKFVWEDLLNKCNGLFYVDATTYSPSLKALECKLK